MPDPAAEALADALSGRYLLERELGRGGMATVYLARDRELQRPVALKVLRADLGPTLGQDRFLREIGIAARLDHPHILALHDSGRADSRLFYVMPYVEGESLRQLLTREPQLSVEETLRILVAVAGALDYAHRAGVIHRDVKPENILLKQDPSGGPSTPLVADFGIARALDFAAGERLTATGLALGTPAYMSPEQAAGGRADSRSDVYSLGCMAYEMLAGMPPFSGPTAQAIMARHAVDTVPPLRTVRPAVPLPVSSAIERALAKVPADRFATAGAFAEALVGQGAGSASGRGDSRRRLTVLLATCAIVMVIGGALAGWGHLRQGSPAAVAPSAASMVVLPLVAPQGDTALTRLGRDLATTISASLDGVGQEQTADRLSLPSEIGGQAISSPAAATALARRIHARSALLGTVIGSGANVRLDLTLYDAQTAVPLARGITATGHRDSLGPLTDSVTWAVLRRVWRRGAPPTPSLAAITTGSLPSLRAFLEGERHVEQGWWESASLAYRSAIAADSTFWLAYFKYAMTRAWLVEDAEPEFQEAFWQHRNVFPERERLLIEAIADPDRSVSSTLQRLQELTSRFPDWWPGWFGLGDLLYHLGPLMGYTWKDSRHAFRRAVTINPKLQPAWDHLFINGLGHDTTETVVSAATLRTLWEPDPVVNSVQAAADIQQKRLLAALERFDGTMKPSESALADSVVRFLVSLAPNDFQRNAFPRSLLWVGNPAGQIAFNRYMVRATSEPEALADAFTGIAFAWAERGRWDSALATIHQAAIRRPSHYALSEYSIAVLGAWLGALPPAEAVARRSSAEATIAGLTDRPQQMRLSGALAWLDGFFAFVRRDRAGITLARQDLRRSGLPNSGVIDGSLAAFDEALSGDRSEAARRLVAIEHECAESGWQTCGGDPRTPNIAAHRLSAATWLLEAGDTVQAMRLLTWHEARLVGQWAWSLIVAPLAYLVQARLEEARGDAHSATEHYRQFLRRYDSPMPPQQHLVDEARAALARLEGSDVSER